MCSFQRPVVRVMRLLRVREQLCKNDSIGLNGVSATVSFRRDSIAKAVGDSSRAAFSRPATHV